MVLTPQQQAELQSVLKAYANGGVVFQDFINTCVHLNYEILKVVVSVDNKYITCTVAPKNLSNPVYPITAFIKQA